MPYATVTEARDRAQRDDDLLNLAADIVQHIAPAPDPEPAEYGPRAARAERAIFRYLDQTDGGVLASKNLTGAGSRTYAQDPAIIRIVTQAMQPPDDRPSGTVRRGKIY